MRLAPLLRTQKDTVVETWFDLIVAGYPGLSAVFLKKQNRFGNPVGMRLHEAAAELYDELLRKELSDQAPGYLGDMMRIRAVQEFSAGEAVGVIFMLKKALRKVFKNELKDPKAAMEMMELCDRVDEMALLAFNSYCSCREQLYEMRVHEVKKRVSGLLRRNKLVVETDQDSPEPDMDESSVNIKRGNVQ
jgi:putative component of toxin-antitoxin plasmid stabilization module